MDWPTIFGEPPDAGAPASVGRSRPDCSGRLLVVLEDLDWADELSLKVVGHVSARLAFGRSSLSAPIEATSSTR